MSQTDLIYLNIWCDSVTVGQRELFLLTLYSHSYATTSSLYISAMHLNNLQN